MKVSQTTSTVLLASRPQKGGLLLTVCACAKLLDNFPVMFPITEILLEKHPE